MKKMSVFNCSSVVGRRFSNPWVNHVPEGKRDQCGRVGEDPENWARGRSYVPKRELCQHTRTARKRETHYRFT